VNKIKDTKRSAVVSLLTGTLAALLLGAVSPVFADFDGFPPMLGQVGSTEILLDDTVRTAAQAEKAGVPFFLEIWEQMPHVFPMFSILPESDVALQRIAKFINSSELDQLPAEYGSSEYRPNRGCAFRWLPASGH